MKLKQVALHITKVCNNKCDFCYLGDFNREEHPSFSKIEKIISELGKQQIEELYFVGGDPCLYPQIIDALKLSKNCGIKNFILSNTLDFGNNLKEVMKYIDSFETTILGPDEKSHDSISNKKGSYKKLMKNIKTLNSQGIKVGIIVNVTPLTFNRIFETVKNLIEKEKIIISYLMIQRIIPRGKVEKNLKYNINPKQVKIFFNDLDKIIEKYKLKIIFEDAFPFCLVDKKFHNILNRCEWGFTKCALDSDGNISRCGSDPRYKLGNIFEKNLQELWENSPILKSFRGYEWLSEKCRNCDLVEKCHCGCSLSDITDKDHTPDILIKEVQK